LAYNTKKKGPQVTLDSYENSLLSGWEDIYKKGQLTLWILLALRDSPKYMAQIKTFITEATSNTLLADDKSMYRALRRYHAAEMITFSTVPSETGPDRKLYQLASAGERVLAAFCERNIVPVFYRPDIQKLIESAGKI